jgi:hypothetical protein
MIIKIRYDILIASVFILNSMGIKAQDKEGNTSSRKWGVTAGIGLNTTSTKSNAVNPIDLNWSIGVIRHFNLESKINHGIHFKFSMYKESFKDLNYYYLNNEGVLVNEKYKQKNSYPMLYLGYNIRYNLKKEAVFLQGSAGFNYMLPAKYKRVFSNKTGTQRYGRPNNLYVIRPELSLGIGLKKTIGNLELEIIPTYAYNFTIKYLNLIPSFHSFGIQTHLNF